MKKKVDTILDEKLIELARQIAVAQDLTMSQLFEEALKKYLDWLQDENSRINVTSQTKGAMKVAPRILKVVMEEESYYET